MRTFILGAALPPLLAACQGTPSVAQSYQPQNTIPAQHKAARFSDLQEAGRKGPPGATWIFAANGESGNVDVYDAKTLKMISSCPCTGVGLAVDPKSGDLAVGDRSGFVTVWHVRKTIVQFATLHLSQGPYAIGIAYDRGGGVYAANAGDNVIDFFSASVIKAGGGTPTRTLFTTQLNDASYLTATNKALVADGEDQNGQPILVSVDPTTGADTIVQRLASGQLPEGITFDARQNLIFNTVGNQNAILVFKKPWTGTPMQTFDYGSGAQNGYYTGVSLNAAQSTLWAGNFTLLNQSHGATNVQANSYPLGSVGGSTSPVSSEFYDSVVADPQAKN